MKDAWKKMAQSNFCQQKNGRGGDISASLEKYLSSSLGAETLKLLVSDSEQADEYGGI